MEIIITTETESVKKCEYCGRSKNVQWSNFYGWWMCSNCTTTVSKPKNK